MSRTERFGVRDMTYSTWHREWAEVHIGRPAAERLDVIDLDWVEFCHFCWQPLALFELAQDRGEYVKTAIITTKLARRAHIPAALVFYRKAGAGIIARFRVRWLAPVERDDVLLGPNHYAAWLKAIHQSHRCNGSYTTDDAVARQFPPMPFGEATDAA